MSLPEQEPPATAKRDLAPEGGYASARMQERRRAVLATTRDLIAERGLHGFSMRQLAQRAGVSTSTLFNIYGSRENLIGQAVVDAFHASLDSGVTDAPASLAELGAYVRWTAREIIALGRYVDVIVAAYFSLAASGSVRALLQRETEAPYIKFLEGLAGEGGLSESVEPAVAARMIAHQIFAAMHAWVVGELSDEDLPGVLERGVMVIVDGCRSGPSKR